jgi:hypothetical protein
MISTVLLTTAGIPTVPKHNQALNDQHWEALRLIEEGRMSLKEIAASIGWSASYLYGLYEGADNVGTIGQLFKAELTKLEKKNTDKIKQLSKSNIKKCLRLMDDFLSRKLLAGVVSDDDAKLVATVHNSLAKSTPNVEIGSMQWNYTKGLTAEELIHEYNKLRSLAEGAPKRRGIPEAGSGEPGEIPSSFEPGGRINEESEGTEV